jgi:hypothetical protein
VAERARFPVPEGPLGDPVKTKFKKSQYKKHKNLYSFLTGSYIYGKPKEDETSDVDLVVFVSQEDCEKLELLSDPLYSKVPGYECGTSLRFGKLNLIAVTNQADWDLWNSGTAHLKGEAYRSGKRFNKDQCILYFNLLKKWRDNP